jgi:cell division septum initiation protein DivIVA
VEQGAGREIESEADPEVEPEASPEVESGTDSEASVEKTVVDAERAAAKVSELANSLIDYASNVMREADQLVEQLRQAAGAVAGSAAGAGDDQTDSDAAPTLSMGAQVLISQLVVGGASRAEIEKRLHDDFGIDDTAGMLDTVLGPDSSD